MKKILFLFAALIMSVASAWADVPFVPSTVDHPIWYTIQCKNANGNTHWTVANSEATQLGQDKNQVTYTKENIDAYSFCFIEAGDGNYYIYSKKGKYVYVDAVTDRAPVKVGTEDQKTKVGVRFANNEWFLYDAQTNNQNTLCSWSNQDAFIAISASTARSNYNGARTVITVVPASEGSVMDLSQLSNDVVYTIESYRRGWWTGKEGSNNIWQTHGINDQGNAFTSQSGKDQDANDPDQKWAILKSEKGNYYLYNVGQQKFFASSTSRANLAADPNEAVVISNQTGTCTGTWLSSYPDVCWAINMSGHWFGVTNWNGQGWQVFQNDGDFAKTTDEGMYFRINAREELDATVKAAALEAIEAFEAAATPATFPKAGTYFLTFTGQASGRKNCLYNDLTQADGYTLQAASQPSPLNNAFIWKAECDGSKMTVVNGQGSTMKLKNGQAAQSGATFNTITYQAHDFGGNTCYYLMPQGVTLGGNHNCLNVASNGNYLNANGSECLTSWSTASGPNAGDNHWAVGVVDVTDLTEYTVNVTGAAGYVIYGEQKAANGGFFLASAAITESDLTASAVSGFDGNVTVSGTTINVEYTVSSTPDWEGLYNAICDTYLYNLGEGLGQYTYTIFDIPSNDVFFTTMNYYEEMLTEQTATVQEVEHAIASIHAMIADLHLNMPKKGQLLRIKSSSNWMSEPTYLAGEKASNEHLAFVQPTTPFDAWAEDNTIWVYDGQYLVNYANGLTFATTAPAYGHATLAMYPNTTSVEFQAAQNGTVGLYNVKFAGNRFMYAQNNNYPNLYTDAGSNANTEGYNFELEDATTYFQLTYSDKGWATGYFPIDVAANPEYGIEAAYVINSDPENGYFTAQTIEGSIPAFTPVVLKVRTDESFRPFVKGAPDSNSTPLPSVLSGALWKQATPANSYVFNVLGGEPGFYKYTGETLGHMKAYYVATTPAASALRINFGDETLTGIMEAIEKEQFSGAIYDLQGRRVNGVQNGVFVKNGKKVIK